MSFENFPHLQPLGVGADTPTWFDHLVAEGTDAGTRWPSGETGVVDEDEIENEETK